MRRFLGVLLTFSLMCGIINCAQLQQIFPKYDLPTPDDILHSLYKDSNLYVGIVVTKRRGSYPNFSELIVVVNDKKEFIMSGRVNIKCLENKIELTDLAKTHMGDFKVIKSEVYLTPMPLIIVQDSIPSLIKQLVCNPRNEA